MLIVPKRRIAVCGLPLAGATRARVAEPSAAVKPSKRATALRFPPCCARPPAQGCPSVSPGSVGGGHTFTTPAAVVLRAAAVSPPAVLNVASNVPPPIGLLRLAAAVGERSEDPYVRVEAEPGS